MGANINKEAIDNMLLDILATDGFDAFIKTALDCLSIDHHGDSKARAQFNGEVCEVVLMGITQTYIKRAKRQARVYHSVVLKDLAKLKSDFRTECDFIMVAPGFILTTECKSYYGDIQVVGNCTLRHAGRDADVYSQSHLHYIHLAKYCQQLMLPSKHLSRPPMSANAFIFSKGNIEDRRTPEQKRTIRINTLADVIQYYDALFNKFKTPVYDYERACKIFGKCASSVKLHEQHKQFLGY